MIKQMVHKYLLLLLSIIFLLLLGPCFLLIHFNIAPVLFFVFIIIFSFLSLIFSVISIFIYKSKIKLFSIVETVLACLLSLTIFQFSLPVAFLQAKEKYDYNYMKYALINKTHLYEPSWFFKGNRLAIYCIDNETTYEYVKYYYVVYNRTERYEKVKKKVLSIEYSPINDLNSSLINGRYLLIKSFLSTGAIYYHASRYIKEGGEVLIKIIAENDYTYATFEYYYRYDASEFEEIYQLAKGE